MFQALSKEVIQIIDILRRNDLSEASQILEQLQQKEKEKLELTVKWQLALEKDRVELDQDADEDERGRLKKRYACTQKEFEKLMFNLPGLLLSDLL